MLVRSKKELAVTLSKLKTFEIPKEKLEQYPTDSEAAATFLWDAYQLGDIEGKTIADLGCGIGILGIGAYLLDAKGIIFVDKDPDALSQLKENLKKIQLDDNYSIIQEDVQDISIQADVVIQNPPFGTRQKHADKIFLEVAKKTAPVIYSVHKTSTLAFVRAWAKDNMFLLTHQWDLSLPLKQSYAHHRKKVERIDVSVVRLEKDLKTS